jgi:hypothetical protein
MSVMDKLDEIRDLGGAICGAAIILALVVGFIASVRVVDLVALGGVAVAILLAWVFWTKRG